ncbi:MAG: hypothetical protein KUG76_08170 [Gammaproteobacteria bacterium]|nr:hypothetical protein [Gammaproteobacteria bacterium]
MSRLSVMGEFSYFEHSQSDGSPVCIPEPDVLDEALTKVITWHDEFSDRAN